MPRHPMELTDEQSEMAYEMGVHAGQEAVETLGRFVELVPTGLTQATTIAAHAYLLHRVHMIIDLMDEVYPGYRAAIEEGREIFDNENGPEFRRHAAVKRRELGLQTTAEREAAQG